MSATNSADALGEQLDRCLADGVVKLGGGTFLGLVSSLLFLKRRRWPVIAGAGVGVGIAYANCQYQINASNLTTQSKAKK